MKVKTAAFISLRTLVGAKDRKKCRKALNVMKFPYAIGEQPYQLVDPQEFYLFIMEQMTKAELKKNCWDWLEDLQCFHTGVYLNLGYEQ